jgi:hypothetical protein
MSENGASAFLFYRRGQAANPPIFPMKLLGESAEESVPIPIGAVSDSMNFWKLSSVVSIELGRERADIFNCL